MSNGRSKYRKKLINRFKLTIFNETTFEEVMTFRLSPLQVIATLCTLAVLLITLTTLLIAFTGLREFIPGYPDSEMRLKITENALQVDSLMNEMAKRDRFFNSIRSIINDEIEEVSIAEDSITHYESYDTTIFGISSEEFEFREMIAEREKFNLSIGQNTVSETIFYHLFPPLNGIITNKFDEKTRHYGIDLVARPNTNVLSVLDGVVIFTDWTLKTGYVIQVQHSNNLVSIYKHNSVLLKKQGDYVKAGEAIAIVGNTGEETTGPHLHFELWQAGKPIDPEIYINLK